MNGKRKEISERDLLSALDLLKKKTLELEKEMKKIGERKLNRLKVEREIGKKSLKENKSY